jgi:hypothetical protein
MASANPSTRISPCWTAFVAIISVAVLTAASPAAAGRTTAMYRMEPRPHGAAAGVTQEQMRTAVVELIEKRGWAAHVRTAGVVEADASWSRNKHRFTVATVFDDETFVIRYLSSYNLGYTDSYCRAPRPGDSPPGMMRDRDRLRLPREERCRTEVIHPSYNDFVQQLEADIAKAIARIEPAPDADPISIPVADSAEEENRRLEGLYAGGVLTKEELQAHQRLLSASIGAAGEVPDL